MGFHGDHASRLIEPKRLQPPPSSLKTMEMKVPEKTPSADPNFGERLKQLRKSRSLNVSELAKRVDVSPAAIWYWENKGRKPRTKTIDALAEALGVTRLALNGTRQEELDFPYATRSESNGLRSAGSLSLQELIQAIEAKGFDVYVRSRDFGLGSR